VARYLSASGTPEDYSQSCQWHAKAAEQGDSFSLEWIIKKCQENPSHQDYGHGLIYWAKRGCEMGLVIGQYTMGTLWESKGDTSINTLEAISWYWRAGKQNHLESLQRLAQIYEKHENEPNLENIMLAINCQEKIYSIAWAKWDVSLMMSSKTALARLYTQLTDIIKMANQFKKKMNQYIKYLDKTSI
jgi:TPR repeat protein